MKAWRRGLLAGWQGKRSGKLLTSNHRVQKHSVVSQQGAKSWRTQKQPGAVYKTETHGKLDESAASSGVPDNSGGDSPTWAHDFLKAFVIN